MCTFHVKACMYICQILSSLMCRGVARSKYVWWTDMVSAECEPITGIWRRSDPPYPSPCKNTSDLYQFQERPLAKVGWTCPPLGDATAYQVVSSWVGHLVSGLPNEDLWTAVCVAELVGFNLFILYHLESTTVILTVTFLCNCISSDYSKSFWWHFWICVYLWTGKSWLNFGSDRMWINI